MRGEGSEDIMPFQSSPNTAYRSLDMGLLGKVAFIILVIVTLFTKETYKKRQIKGDC